MQKKQPAVQQRSANSHVEQPTLRTDSAKDQVKMQGHVQNAENATTDNFVHCRRRLDRPSTDHAATPTCKLLLECCNDHLRMTRLLGPTVARQLRIRQSLLQRKVADTLLFTPMHRLVSARNSDLDIVLEETSSQTSLPRSSVCMKVSLPHSLDVLRTASHRQDLWQRGLTGQLVIRGRASRGVSSFTPLRSAPRHDCDISKKKKTQEWEDTKTNHHCQRGPAF